MTGLARTVLGDVDPSGWGVTLVHEHVIVDGRVARLAGDLLHYTMPSYADAVAKMNRYSSDSAATRAAAGRRGGVGRALVHAAWAFVRSYVVRRGFLDGGAGFVVAAYVAEGTWWRYLKIAEHARRLPEPTTVPPTRH